VNPRSDTLIFQDFSRPEAMNRRSAKAGVIVVFNQLFLTSGWNLEPPKGLINMSRGVLATNE
jgi:hypothetical protein